MRRFLLFSILFVMACSQSRTPLVGITCSRSVSGAPQLQTAYSEAIFKAGGIPVVIPMVSTREEADAILAKLDGIVFSGGKDVSPAMYGEKVLNESVKVDTVRDCSESLLARAALDSGKPILAICRGSQLMNVILGGTLYQDIPTQIPDATCHGGGVVHKIGLEKGSVLASVYDSDSLEVNSYHHQAVKDPAPGIRITARSADGIIEAYETSQIIAVQFHPEKSLQSGDSRSLPLFEAFINRL